MDRLSNKTTIQNYLGDYQKGQTHLALDDLLAVLGKNRRKLAVDPTRRGFQEAVEREYAASLVKLLPIKTQLAATDRLIDPVVYRLYGLTEDEIALVAESISRNPSRAVMEPSPSVELRVKEESMMLEFSVVIENDEDGYFVFRFIDPHIWSQGTV